MDERTPQLTDRRELEETEDQFIERRQIELQKKLDRRRNSADRRTNSANRRNTWRFNASEDNFATIVVREDLKTVDDDGNVTHSEIVDSQYEVTLVDQSSGGFGFLISSETQLQVGHVIRMAKPGGMHMVRICRIVECQDDTVLHVGGEYLEDLVGQPAEVSILELFVDRRLNTSSAKTTFLIVGTVAIAWSAVICYTLLTQIQ